MPYTGDPTNYPPCIICGTTDRPRYWHYYARGRCLACTDVELEKENPGLKYQKNPYLASIANPTPKEGKRHEVETTKEISKEESEPER